MVTTEESYLTVDDGVKLYTKAWRVRDIASTNHEI